MTTHTKNGVPRGLSGYLITAGNEESLKLTEAVIKKRTKEYRKRIRVLDKALYGLRCSLNNPKSNSSEWHDDLYRKMAEISAKMDEVKKELAVHLDVDENAVKKHIVSVVTKKNHELDSKYFQDSGSEEYNKVAGIAIVELINQGVLNIDLEWNLYLGKYKLPK
ncbi:MAG: hypothetical protein Q8P07_03230 [bacterium]|nr:hypothetical protein [bacterium]